MLWSGKGDFDLVEPLFSRLKAYGSLILTCHFVSIAKGIYSFPKEWFLPLQIFLSYHFGKELPRERKFFVNDDFNFW